MDVTPKPEPGSPCAKCCRLAIERLPDASTPETVCRCLECGHTWRELGTESDLDPRRI